MYCQNNNRINLINIVRLLVVNLYHNATLIAGCLDVTPDTLQQFNGQSLCQRRPEFTVCACKSFDTCNSPEAPSSGFKFVDEPILNAYHLVPADKNSEGKNYVFFDLNCKNEAIT